MRKNKGDLFCFLQMEVIKKIYEGEADEYEKISGIDKGRDNSGVAI